MDGVSQQSQDAQGQLPLAGQGPLAGQAPVQQEPPAQPPAATVPSQAASAAPDRGNAAPPQSVAREAFRRLAKGELPQTVNRDLYQGSSAPRPAERALPSAAATPSAPAQPTKPAEKSQGHPPTAEPSQPPAQRPEDAIEAEDLRVLKRAKFDLSTWKHIPPSNRKAIVNSLRESQAEMDRQFTKQRQQAQAPKPTPAGAASQDPPASADEGTPGDGPQDNPATRRAQPAPQPPQGQGAPKAGVAQPLEAAQFIDPKDLETLTLIGGEDLADVHKRGIAAVVDHVNSQLMPALTFLLGEYEDAQFSRAVADLKGQPGYGEILGDAQKVQQLRQKTAVFLEAAGDPRNYRIGDAVRDAAASLFSTNVHQHHQQALLQGRAASLQGSPESGRGQRVVNQPLTGAARMKAIFRELRRVGDPNQARRNVDGA